MPRRTKTTSAPERAPEPFAVGVAGSSPEEAPPQVCDNTIDGLLSLRNHLAQEVPGADDPGETAILWPLKKLPSFQQHMSDMESATDAVDRISVRHALSSSKLAELRQFLVDDAYAWGYLICKHRDMRPEIHMAMCYAAAGQAGKLAWYLTRSGFDGYVPEHFRQACRAKGINLATSEGIRRLDRALDYQDQRWPRGTYKSSGITHTGLTLTAADDPNTTSRVAAAKDDKAFDLILQAGDTFQSGTYLDFFPDRKALVATMKKVTLDGRTISHRQTTIQGAGIISKEVSGHFDRWWVDDLVVRGPGGNATPTGMREAWRWLAGMQGMFMITPRGGRVRRVHVGTNNDMELDDRAWLRHGERAFFCFGIDIPVELHDEPPKSVFDRGEPTMPTFFGRDKIEEAFRNVVTHEQDQDGIEQWLSDYWLNPAAAGSLLFDDDVVADSERTWLGPYKHPKSLGRFPDDDYASRFLVGKVIRDEFGSPELKDGRQQIETFDPWNAELDKVLTLYPTWSEGGKRWAVSVAFVDSDLTKYQIETRIGDDGIEGWTAALAQLASRYEPRAIGIEKSAFNDPVVQNKLSTDLRLRPLKSRCVPVGQTDVNEHARLRAAVAEPLKLFRLLLLRSVDGDAQDFGARVTRREMTRYRPGMTVASPVLESLAMVESIAKRPMSKKDRAKMRTSIRIADERYRRAVQESGIGVPAA